MDPQRAPGDRSAPTAANPWWRLIAFLVARRKANKNLPLKPGQLRCFKCREPRTPKESVVVYQAQTPALGNLIGLCPVCETRMFRRVSFAKMAQSAGQLKVTLPQALEHIDESDQPSVNSGFKQDG